MKNSFKFLTIGLAIVLLIVSQVSFNRTASAVTSIDQDTVTLLDSSKNVVDFYKPGVTAAFYIADTDLQTTKSGTATWTTLAADVANTVDWSLTTGSLTGTPTAASFALSAGNFYSTTTSATTTPLISISPLSVTLDGSNATVGSFNTSGSFKLLGATSTVAFKNQTAVATFTHHIQDVYVGTTSATPTASQNLAKVISTSDSGGEWVTISEVQNLGISALSATSTIFRGNIDLSADAGSVSAGDGKLWVQDGDTITVTYYASDHTTVKSTITAKIDATTPAVASISPADESVSSGSVPSVNFTITDGGSGLSTSDPGSNVDLTINGCPVLDSELGFPSRTTSALQVSFAPTGTDKEWSDAATPSCVGRTGGGFNVDTTTIGANSHGVAFKITIVATDIAGNALTLSSADNTQIDVTVDTVAPDMQSAVAGKGWDSANKAPADQANSIQVNFNESLAASTVSAADFKVDGTVPSSVLVAGVNDGTKLENEIVFLTMGANLAVDARPKIEMVGSIKDKAGNELKPATGQTVADTVTATDGIPAVLSGIAVSSQLLAKDGTLKVDFSANENLTSADATLAAGCTCIAISGTGNASTTQAVKGVATLTTPKIGTFTFKQSDFLTTGIYGLIINGRDLGANNTVGGAVLVNNEDVSSQFTATLAAGTTKVIKILNWPIADANANGNLADEFTTTIKGNNTTTTVTAIDWSAAWTDVDGNGKGTVTMKFSTAVAVGDKVLVTYNYVAAAQAVEVDVAAPKISFDPASGTTIDNRTPFITIKFNDTEYAGDTFTKSTPTKATLLDPAGVTTNILPKLSSSDGINWVYLSTSTLALGDYTLTARGKDEAGNESTDATGTFTIQSRALTQIDLRPGWNLISLPSDPISAAINDAITVPAVDTVLTYDPKTAGKWLTAVRDSAGKLSGTLSTITSSRAYWVHTTTFDPIKVDLPGLSAGSALLPPSISLVKGWNLVPVATLDSAVTKVDADKYFSGLKWSRAYGYDTATGKFTAITPEPAPADLTKGDTVAVQKGYWLFISEAGDLVP